MTSVVCYWVDAQDDIFKTSLILGPKSFENLCLKLIFFIYVGYNLLLNACCVHIFSDGGNLDFLLA